MEECSATQNSSFASSETPDSSFGITSSSVQGLPNNRPFINPLFPIPEDVIEIRDLLRNGSFFWTSFSPKRVRAAIRLANPDLGVGEEVDNDSESDDPVSCDDPVEGASLPPSKGKGIDLGDIIFSLDDSVLPGWDPNLAYGDGSGSSDMPLPDFDGFFDGLPPSFDISPPMDKSSRSTVVAEGSRSGYVGSRLELLELLILGPRKSRLNLFTRKQQKILKKAREMDGTPDLSDLLKGKLQLLKNLTTEATSANPTGGDISQEVDRSYPIDQTVDTDPPGSKRKKKSLKKKKNKEAPSEGDAAPGGKVAIFEGFTDDSSLKKKKTKKTKRPHEDLDGHEGLDNDSSKEVSEENPEKKKNSKKEGPVKKAQQSPGLEEAPIAQGSPRVGEEAVARDSQEKASSKGVLARTESPGGPRVLPVKDQGTVPPCVSSSEGSLGRG
ncbi:hypothetical protein Bca52824_023442 [Brassica carinata]|uniref:Uncharacterized protein n=1 Tax=Brassica carinata TaxID=52824 RepID=A0A8X7VI92_BRACI|nr:hypothetical protein Bca52824_023442 [Brassica carinata]